jgi:hypothetical protein
MKLALRAVIPLSCMVLSLAVASTAHAVTFSVSGSVWEGGYPDNSNVPVSGSAIYGTTATATFTVTNSVASSLLNFDSGNDSGLTTFLQTGYSPSGPNGDTVTYLSGASHGSDSVDNDLFQFIGTTSLANGTYTFEHDDGFLLYLNGVEVVSEPGETAAATTTLCVGTTGCTYNIASTGGAVESFQLDYGESNGPPAVLATNLPLVGTAPPPATPEPSSLVLMGTGMLAFAGAVRRRLFA